MQPKRSNWTETFWVPALFLIVVLVAAAFNQQVGLIRFVPMAFRDPLKALVVLLVGASLSAMLEGFLARRRGSERLGVHQITTIRFMVRLVLYVGIGVAVLAAFGVGVSSFLFGGAFLTVILGLAGQTMFQNLLGGLWLVFFHPFEVGETIEIMAWQYPLLMPSFPHEALRPSYVGRVIDLNIMYTHVELESGLPLAVPNGILVSAAIGNRTRTGWRVLRVRYELSAQVRLDGYVERLQDSLRALAEFQSGPRPEVWLIDLSKDSASVVALVPYKEGEDRVRHVVLNVARRLADEATPRLPDPA